MADHGVSVLAGGPGTGKSRTVAAVVSLAAERGLRVALAAPTGRAAKRLEELAGAPATTLHRLLGAQGRSRGEPADGRRAGEPAWIFTRNEEWPVDADVVVVDESSMLDAELAAALVEACADGTRLLLVGDPAQLPSIGPGRVLADIIDSGAVPGHRADHPVPAACGRGDRAAGHRRARRRASAGWTAPRPGTRRSSCRSAAASRPRCG